MRNSKLCSTKQTHLFCCEDHKKIVQDELEGSNFGIREFPMKRLFNEGRRNTNASGGLSDFSKGKNCAPGMNVMDHDMPELVVFIQEDHQQFVKDICIDKVVSPEGKHQSEEYELDHEIVTCEGEEAEELDSTNNHKISIDQPIKKSASETLREAFRKETDFSRSFKNWQINSFLAAIGSKVEFPHCAECPQVTQASMSRTETSNTHSITGSGKRQVDYPQETSSIALASLSGPTPHTAPATTSHNASHKSNDSMSSTHSFAFPILPVEWNGSPVRMLEADKSQSRKHWWEKILFPCCK